MKGVRFVVVRVWVLAAFVVWAILPASAAGAGEDYKMLNPAEVNCQLRSGGRIELDVAGLLNADKTELLCEGKSVDLVDGKVEKGWLATKNFGKIKFASAGGSRINMFVTDKQKQMLLKAFKKLPM